MAEGEQTYCARHPEVETRLFCGKCDTPICPRCLVHSPVGARCPKCAQLRRLPTFELSGGTYLRAVSAGVVLAAAVGALWGFLFFQLFSIPFLPWVATIGVGYIIGEGISVAVNRKRGRSLQYVAGACMVLSYVVAGFVSQVIFLTPFFLLALVIAIFVAAGRVG